MQHAEKCCFKLQAITSNYKQTRGKPRAALQATLSFIDLLSGPFSPMALGRCQAQTVRNSASKKIVAQV